MIDYQLGLTLLIITIPAALIGTWVGARIEPDVLKVILGVGLFAVALSFLRTPQHSDIARLDQAIAEENAGTKAETCLTTAAGERICYTVCNRIEGGLIAGIGGLFVGMISTGLGEMNGYFLLQRCRVPSSIAVATSVFVVAFTVLVAATGHVVQFAQTGGDVMNTVLSLVTFTVPGVIIGGQLGSLMASRISQHVLERTLGGLFIVIAVLTLGEVIL